MKGIKQLQKEWGSIGGKTSKEKWKKIIEEYDKNPSRCMVCHKPLSYYKRKFKFCSSSCSAKFNNQHRIFEPSKDRRTKIGKCVSCGKSITVNIRADLNKIKCVDCYKKQQAKYNSRYILKNEIFICKYCGQEKCPRPDICRKHKIFPALVKYFGFNKSKIGTIGLYEEFDRIRNKLIEEYWDKKISTTILAQTYKHNHNGNFNKILDVLEIGKRTISAANHLSFANGNNYPPTNPKYKHGWHTTWDNKQVFYRSSYELKYAKELDEKKIEYEMESLRILYWDTKLLCQRVAIPDFYLPKQNKIVEIKSPWTLDEQNMKDKEKAYKEHGYDFELIVKIGK
jgi:hypothetical protein